MTVGMEQSKHVMVLGVGNLLFTDEGIGIRVIQKLQEHYRVPGNVSLVDGGTLGIHLLGMISKADHLIVVDAVRNNGSPGTFYRLSGDEIPRRILAKNSLHQVDLLEALTLCQVFNKVPETVILGVEPEDTQNPGVQLSPMIQDHLDDLVEKVLDELSALGVPLEEKNEEVSSCV